MKQPINEAQRKAFARAFELKREGRTWAQIAEALEREGFKDTRGKPYTLTNLRSWHSRLKGQAPVAEGPPMPQSIDTVDKVDTLPERGRPDTLTREEVTAMLEGLETRLRELIETRLEAEKPEPKIALPLTTTEEPPLPPKEGKKFKGNKADIRVRVDENLGKMFEADVNRRFGGNASRAMDALLWNFYGKPLLSFETSKEPDKESDAWSVLHSTPESAYDD